MSDEQAGLDPDEPRTPAWFTFLGLGIFLVAGIFMLICSSNDSDPSAAEANSAEAANSADEAMPNGNEPHGHAPHD